MTHKMKNLHLLPTDKPSRLYLHSDNELQLRTDIIRTSEDYLGSNQHIYITKDEEIKDGDWCIHLTTLNVSRHHSKDNNLVSQYWYKIILTTDQYLIKDGVQAIDDEFLEWFVKNPSCENVKVEYDKDVFPYGVETAKGYGWYKIIIPQESQCTCKEHDPYCCQIHGNCPTCVKKEEPKQETLEEAKLRQLFKNRSNCYADTGRFENDGSYSEGEVIQAMDEDCFINVIKEWQAERMYSEEDLKRAFEAGHKKGFSGYPNTENWKELPFEKWFEQFKKK